MRWALAATLLLAGAALAQKAPEAPPVPMPAAPLAPAVQADSIRVQVVPLHSTLISSEIAGRVAALDLKEGDRFAKGQLLVALDCDVNRARLEKARAQASEAEKTLAVNRQLARLGSVSELELEVSEARLRGAKAETALMDAMVKRCEIVAPFPGRVVKLQVRPHQFVPEGQALIELLDDQLLEIEMVVPSRSLPRLKPGTRFKVRVDETGGSYDARVTRVGARIDPVSQSVKLFGVFDPPSSELLSGMSGSARFK